jgi:hypothetical protein
MISLKIEKNIYLYGKFDEQDIYRIPKNSNTCVQFSRIGDEPKRKEIMIYTNNPPLSNSKLARERSISSLEGVFISERPITKKIMLKRGEMKKF